MVKPNLPDQVRWAGMLFIGVGVVRAVAEVVLAKSTGPSWLGLTFAVIEIVVGLGLLQLSRVARQLAFVFAAFALLGSISALLSLPTILARGPRMALYGIVVIVTVAGLVTAGYLLGRPAAKAVFQRAPNPGAKPGGGGGAAPTVGSGSAGDAG